MYCQIFLCVCVSIALGGRSPHADYIEMKYAGDPDIPEEIIEDALLDVPDLVAKYGYPIESHDIFTSDGYNLTAHRIPHGRHHNTVGNRPVVFLMHGLLASSADYLILGPSNALAYYLADEGYDVWLGNARGSFYSRNHRTLNPDNPYGQFWRFSWDEIGLYDLIALIDYVLAFTHQSRLHYIGHSQGGTTFFVLNSLRPEYNEKFISFHGLAPASFFTNNENPFLLSLAPMENVIEASAFALGIGEVFGSRAFIEWFIALMCRDNFNFEGLCDYVQHNNKLEYYNKSIIPIIVGHAPAGASIRQFSHYAQGIKFNNFARYNYNTVTNLANYGTRRPPEYDFKQVTVPAYIYYGNNDTLVNPKDVELLASKLPKLQSTYLVPKDYFDHLDFVWGSDVKELVYLKVLELMREAEVQFQ